LGKGEEEEEEEEEEEGLLWLRKERLSAWG